MIEKENIEGLYSPAGCLTLETMKRYHAASLSPKEKTHTEKHLESCELCQDALEGLLLVSNPEKIDSIVSEINENLRSNLPAERSTRTIRLSNKMYYLAAAASVVIFLGIFSYFQFYMQDQNTQLSVITEEKNGGNFKSVAEEIKSEVEEEEIEEAEAFVPVSPAEGENKTLKASEKGQNDVQLKEADSDMDLVVEIASIPEADQSGTSDIIEKTIIEQPSATGFIEEPTEYVIGRVTITGDGTVDEVLTLEDEATEVMEPASNSLRMRPVSAKKSKGRTATDSDEEGVVKDEDQYFIVAEKMPEFAGGEHEMFKYLRENTHYPDSAKTAGIQGMVYVSFVVRETGKIDSAKVQRGIGGGCDEEALRVVNSMPDWIPGEYQNKPVNVQLILPIEFKLNH